MFKVSLTSKWFCYVSFSVKISIFKEQTAWCFKVAEITLCQCNFPYCLWFFRQFEEALSWLHLRLPLVFLLCKTKPLSISALPAFSSKPCSLLFWLSAVNLSLLEQRLEDWLPWIQSTFAGCIKLFTATFKYKTYFTERDLLIVSHMNFQELSLDFLFAVNLCSNPEDKLQIYRDNFEKAYLDSTERFYRTQAPSYLQQNGVQNYMKYVSKNSAVILFWKCWCLKWWLFYFCTGRC